MSKARIYLDGGSGGQIGRARRLLQRIVDRSADHAIKRRKKKLSAYFESVFSGEVRYGPFRGLRLPPNSWWGASDRAAMLFGFYEKEVLDIIAARAPERSVLLDLGAADGYYAVGATRCGLFEKAICFEIAEAGRDAIQRNSVLNDVEARVEVLGAAGDRFYEAVPASDLAKSFILVDVEGAEFSIFTRETLAALAQCELLIELHDFSPSQERASSLREAASEFFNSKLVKTGARDLSPYPELHALRDADRWLVCSENRPSLMSWLHLQPK